MTDKNEFPLSKLVFWIHLLLHCIFAGLYLFYDYLNTFGVIAMASFVGIFIYVSDKKLATIMRINFLLFALISYLITFL
ncbi:hypothetical protein BFG57_15820 [Bacillus solimangrovi]|uniref:Uncharacterized protein n=1 Tax=Bacillus solimangrovi TaxID=1305675 RepID=A0A1E5LED9_9BACI|nr:hypothetical protein BFG57_15820 [Bacillus solimangrovi]